MMLETIFNDNTPWSNQFGDIYNRNASPVQGAKKGQVLWSVELAGRFLKHIAVGIDKFCFVVHQTPSDVYHLTAIQDGQIKWEVKSDQGIGQPFPLTKNRLLVLVGNSLLIKSQQDGSVIKSIPLQPWANVSVSTYGHILYDNQNLNGNRQLTVMDLEGNLLWSRPIDKPLWYPPLLFDDLIIIGGASFLTAYNLEGDLVWFANQNGFQPTAELPTKLDASNDSVSTPLIGFDKNQILAGLRWYTGFGFYIFDLDKHTARPLQPTNYPPLPAELPLAIALLEDKPCLITRNAHDETIALDMIHNKILWRHKAVITPETITTDINGKIFVSYSPSYEIWEKYKNYFEEERCFLKCFDILSGNELFTWVAPAPISRPVAIGKDCIYLGTDRCLWAIE